MLLPRAPFHNGGEADIVRGHNMSSVIYGLADLPTWLLMGVGVVLTFRVTSRMRRGGNPGAKAQKGVMTPGLIRVSLTALVVLASMGIAYAGAYIFYHLTTGS